MTKYVVWFTEREATQRLLVGGKVAGLAEMLDHHIRVPPGFAVAAPAFSDFLLASDLGPEIRQILNRLDIENTRELEQAGERMRRLLAERELPMPIAQEIDRAYGVLSQRLGAKDPPVAVRSSATAEDTEAASFAGEYESYL